MFFPQSLWHIKRFREEFLATSSLHSHITDPCVVCALYEIFLALNKASEGGDDDAVEPTTLRLALSNLYPDSNFFQEVICYSCYGFIANLSSFVGLLQIH